MLHLDLRNLGNGFPGMLPSHGDTLAQAGGVCLQSQGHIQGVLLQVKGYLKNTYSMNWPAITQQARKSLNDPNEATEWGAVGVAILLAKSELGYSVLERSRKGTGFDYWIGDETELPFDRKAKLEISGIRKGSNLDVKARVREKLKQVARFGHSPTAYVIVVEFGTPLASCEKK
jgi:hypothetical protein